MPISLPFYFWLSIEVVMLALLESDYISKLATIGREAREARKLAIIGEPHLMPSFSTALLVLMPSSYAIL